MKSVKGAVISPLGWAVLAVFLASVAIGCAPNDERGASDPGSGVGDSAGDTAPGDSAGDNTGDNGGDSAGDTLPGDGAGDILPGDGAGDGMGDAAGDSASSYPCPAATALTVQQVTVDDLYAAISAGELLAVVDVRDGSEQATGIIEGALRYSWRGNELQTRHNELPTDRPLYVICQLGGRSAPAAQFLVDNGHFCVRDTTGGMSAWRTAGYPTVLP